jgi:hypothetical protein
MQVFSVVPARLAGEFGCECVCNATNVGRNLTRITVRIQNRCDACRDTAGVIANWLAIARVSVSCS